MGENHKLTLIYLDDEEINLIMFSEMFKKDFNIFTTTSPDEALTFLKENKVDLIVTDQLMPIMTGVEFLREIKQLFPETHAKRIMISGYTREGEIEEALEDELLDEFVSKPWKYDELRRILTVS
ncbi:MAG: response regulator [Bacteroidota bacterium]